MCGVWKNFGGYSIERDSLPMMPAGLSKNVINHSSPGVGTP
jgi:hypothetical protein